MSVDAKAGAAQLPPGTSTAPQKHSPPFPVRSKRRSPISAEPRCLVRAFESFLQRHFSDSLRVEALALHVPGSSSKRHRPAGLLRHAPQSLCGSPARCNRSGETESGTDRMVRTLLVTSSPVTPSPRVRAVCNKALPAGPGSYCNASETPSIFNSQTKLTSAAADHRPHAPFPITQLLFAVHVVQREHGPRMIYLGETLLRLAAHALAGRVGVTSSG